MKHLEKLRKRLKEILGELRSLQNKVEADDHREMTEEENKTYRELELEFDKVKESVEREERLQERESANGGRFETEAPGETRGKSGDGEEERKLGNSQPAGPFKTLGEQLIAVIRAGSGQGNVDKRLLEMRAPQGMSESVPADGGFLVQQEYMTELTKAAYETGIVTRDCRKLPIGPGKNGVKLNMIDEISRANGSRNGGILAYWLGEAEQKPKTFPKIRQMELNLKKLVGLIPITDELLEDAIALESWVRMLFADEFGFQLDNAVINGNGVGQPLGVLQSPCLVTQDDESMQAAAELLWLNIVKMYSRLPAASIPNAKWYYNSEVFPALATMKFSDDADTPVPIFTPANAGNSYNSILGLPLVPIEQAAALGTPGDLILGDFKQYLLIEKGGIQTAMSIHVRFDYDESMLRFVLRCDGQPLWRAPLTPFKGSATKSPFVVLNTRNGS